MKRWNISNDGNEEFPAIDAFLNDISAVCQKHGMVISHEDTHGAFVIESASTDLGGWLAAAMVGSSLCPPMKKKPATLRVDKKRLAQLLAEKRRRAVEATEASMRRSVDDLPDSAFGLDP